MTCDHSATRASFAAFFGATKLIGGQDLGDGQWALLGTCVACNTTLAIQIAEPRGNAVHGLIETARQLATTTGQPLTAAEELELAAVVHADSPPVRFPAPVEEDTAIGTVRPPATMKGRDHA